MLWDEEFPVVIVVLIALFTDSVAVEGMDELFGGQYCCCKSVSGPKKEVVMGGLGRCINDADLLMHELDCLMHGPAQMPCQLCPC